MRSEPVRNPFAHPFVDKFEGSKMHREGVCRSDRVYIGGGRAGREAAERSGPWRGLRGERGPGDVVEAPGHGEGAR